MPFLGLDGLQWFVAIDLFVLMGSTALAAALFHRLRTRDIPPPRIPETEEAPDA